MIERLRRRSFFKASATVVGMALHAAGAASARSPGLYKVLSRDPESDLAQIHAMGFTECEIYNDNFEPRISEALIRGMSGYGIRAVALFSMGPGKMTWDFRRGPSTIGLVPREFRSERIRHLKDASEFAKKCGIPAVETHCGFIPEDPNCGLYEETVSTIREVAGYCKANGQNFLYHAGQETPVTLLRIIRDVGLDNQGVGLDTANLIVYGKGHPVDALEMIRPWLRLVNAKDGLYPRNPDELGKETPIGQGKVDFPRLLRKLKEIGYTGPILIEREIPGPQFIEDVRRAKEYLSRLMAAEGLR